MAGKKPGRRQGQKPRNRLQIESDKEQICNLTLKGYNPLQIEKALKGRISRETIRLTVKKLEKEWANETKEQAMAAIGRDLRRLGMVIAESFRAWDESLKERKETTKAEIEKPMVLRGFDGSHVETHTETRNSVKKFKMGGDPRYLQVIVQSITEIHRLLGTYKRTEELGEEQAEGLRFAQTLYIPGLGEITPEQLQQLQSAGNQDLWHFFYSLLQNQNPHQYDGPMNERV